MSSVKWIKIDTNIFDDEKIKLIEALPSADSIIVIWFKLLCLAGQSNNSGIFMLSDRIAYTDEMLAAIFRRDVSTVRLALSTFQQYGMIEVIDDVFTIPNWDKHQSLDAYEKRKESDRIRQQKSRDKKKLMIAEKKTDKKTSRDDNVSVTGFCSLSSSISSSNISNLDYVLNNSDYKNSIYILNNNTLYDCIKDWMEYKDEKVPKKDHHYTEKGMKMTLTEIVNYDMDYGTEAVVRQMRHAMVEGWKGMNLNLLEKQEKKLPRKKPEGVPIQDEPEMTDEEWLRSMAEENSE